MKKLLVITYHYPPGKEVSGRRVQQLVEHLPSFGWDYRILTIRRGTREKKVYESNFLELTSRKPLIQKLVKSNTGKEQQWRNIIRAWKRAVFIPDEKIGWLPFAYKEACRIIQEEQIDAVLISCGPFSTSLLAPLLKRKTNIPIILDFQDAWTVNPYTANRWSSRCLERWVLRYVDYLLTTTPTTTRVYRKQYPGLPAKTIYVGFNEALFQGWKKKEAKKKRRDTFTILYAGTLDKFRRIELFLEAVKELPFKDVKVEIYGELYQYPLMDYLEQYKMRNVRYCGFIDERKLLRVLQKADLLLLLQSFALLKRPCIPIAAKTFPYIRSGIPLLYIGPAGDNAAFIKAYAHTFALVTKPSVAAIKQALTTLYQSSTRKQERRVVQEAFLKHFNTHAITASLVEVLKKVKPWRREHA